MFVPTTPEDAADKNFYQTDERTTKKLEAKMRRYFDKVVVCVDQLAVLEQRLKITERWHREHPEFKEVENNIRLQDYRKAVDHLEALVVSHLFKLTKMNHSGTGYKLRTLIAKGLKTRSKAIQAAIAKLNDICATLFPERPALDTAQVLDYVFLAEFDLLRDSRNKIGDKQWAQPAERDATNAYFKLKRSKEEIQRLNVEIKRLWYYMRDEEEYLDRLYTGLKGSKLGLAKEVERRRVRFVSVNNVHRARLASIEMLPGYSGDMIFSSLK